MTLLEKPLERLAEIQNKHAIIILVLVLLFTSFISFGIKDIELESDMMEQMPQHLPVFELNDKIRATFSGQDTIFLLFMLDENVKSQMTPKDILAPEILEYVTMLEEDLQKESSIDTITSIAPVVRQANQIRSEVTTESVKDVLDHSPQSWELISDDRSKMIMILTANVGSSEGDITRVNNMINDKISSYSTPPGTNVLVTGTPPLHVAILGLLRYDSVYTLLLAFVIIMALLLAMQRSIKKAGIVSIPLILGVAWTAGSLGWLGIKISFATAGLGAMILGLGVEYGVFMLTRYEEERIKRKKKPAQAIKTAVPSVGAAIVGSGTTTIIGFLALTLSIIPMMQNLGLSLAMGIFYCIIAAVLVEPIVILSVERVSVAK